MSTQPDDVVATTAEGSTHELQSIDVPEAGPSKASDTYNPPAKKRRVASWKGKARDDYEGHPWDCTGLVQRFTSADQVPRELVKCKPLATAAPNIQTGINDTSSFPSTTTCLSFSTRRDGSPSPHNP